MVLDEEDKQTINKIIDTAIERIPECRILFPKMAYYLEYSKGKADNIIKEEDKEALPNESGFVMGYLFAEVFFYSVYAFQMKYKRNTTAEEANECTKYMKRRFFETRDKIKSQMSRS